MKLLRTKWLAISCMTAAAVAGGPLFAGIGAPIFNGVQPAATPAVDLLINGTSAGVVHKVEGGEPAGKIPSTLTRAGIVTRVAGQAAYTPLKLSLDADAGRPFWLLVKSALDGKGQTFDGTLRYLDSQLKDVKDESFRSAVITGLTIPARNGTATSPLFVVTLDEANVTTTTGNGATVAIGTSSQQRAFASSHMVLTLGSVQGFMPSSWDEIDLVPSPKGANVTNHLVLRYPLTASSSAYAGAGATGNVVNGRLSLVTTTGEDLLDFSLVGVALVKLSNGSMTTQTQVVVQTMELAVKQMTLTGGTLL